MKESVGMMENVYSIRDISEMLYPIFHSYGVRKAILFGSYAKGWADRKSDVDIFIDASLRALPFCGMCEKVRERLGKEIDMFQAGELKPDSEMLANIDKEGVVIYEGR